MLEGTGKVEANGITRRLYLEDTEGAKEFWGELGGVGEVKVGCAEQGIIIDFEREGRT